MKQLSTRTIALIALVAVAVLAIGVFAVQNLTKIPIPVVENREGQENQGLENQGEDEGTSNEYAFELQSDLDTSDWKTYRNEMYGFEFNYPPQGKVEEFGAGQPPSTFDGVVHVYEDKNGDVSIVLTVYREKSGTQIGEVEGGEFVSLNEVVIPNSYSYNPIIEAYVMGAVAKNGEYRINFRIDDYLPEDVQFPEKYIPTFPQSDLFYEVLKSFQFIQE